MMEMKEQTGSRKKLLVPVVVLMLCLVTLTGAAYAYSSSMTYTTNTVDAKSLTVDLSTGSVEDDVTSGLRIITFTDNFGYTYVDEVQTKTNTIKYELESPVNIATYKVKITGDAAFTAFKVSSDVKTKIAYDTTTIGTLFDVTYTVHKIVDEAVVPVIAATEIGTSVANTDWLQTMVAGDNVEYIVTVIATASGETTGNAKTVSNPATTPTAATYAAALKAVTFSVSVEAIE
jgi:hypothetical protein